MIRIILVGVFIVLLLLLSLPVLLFETIYGRYDERRALLQSTAIIRWAFKVILFISGTRVRVSGLENVPEHEAVLFVGNHRSYFDIVSTYAVLREPLGFVAKVEMNRIPILRLWMKRIGCLLIDRSDPKEGLKTILRAIDQVKSGVSVFIYPEGTRNPDPDPRNLMDFHEGSLKIAQKSGCRIVPVAICGTDDAFERHIPFIKKAEVHIRFGEPFYTNDIPQDYGRKHGLYLRDLIKGMLEESLG